MKRKKTLFKRVISVMCTLVLILTLSFYGTKGDVLVVVAAEGDIAWNQLSTVFPDADVCEAVKDGLKSAGLQEGDVVTQANLNYIFYLEVDKANGTINLQGVERLQGIETLHLEGDIQSLAPLNNLTKLDNLFFEDVDSEISFTQMSNVSSITTITFVDCQGINSLDGLENNAGIDSLQIEYCDNLTDISACSGYTSLTYASFYSCDTLEDISPLAGIQTLRTVDIGSTAVKDISALSGKTSIITLKMQNSKVFGDNVDASCQVLGTLTNLEELCLRNSDIDDVAFSKICNITNLRLLDLLGNNITDLTPVTRLVNLTVLDIGDNAISNFTPLASLANLRGYSCCNVGEKGQYVVVSGPNRTIANPFVAMDGSAIVPAQTNDFTYDATDNAITFIGDDWQYANQVGTAQMNYYDKIFDMKLYIRYENIIDPITITTQPESVSVMEDDEIILSVVAESYDDNFRYQWYKGDDKLEGEKKSTFTIEEAKPEDAGSYKCVVSNATATATSDVAKIEVKKEEVTTQEPTTTEPTTTEPTTQEPITTEPTTSEPTTQDPTTSEPTTTEPTTQAPSTGSTTDVTPEDNTTAAPTTTEAVNTDAAVTTGDTVNLMIAIMVLLFALMGMIFVRRACSYKEQ